MDTIQGTLFREPNAPAGTPPLVLFFETKPVKNERASRDGPPVFDTVDQVRVVVAGQRSEGPIYEMIRVSALDGATKRGEGWKRFSKPYEEWKAGMAQGGEAGTPLEQWPLMDVAMVATLKAMHVYTVQQLSDLSDADLDRVFRRGGREWRAKAQGWLKDAATAAGDVEARARIAELEQKLEETQALLRESLKKQNTPGYDKRQRSAKRTSGDDVLIDMPNDEIAEALEGERL